MKRLWLSVVGPAVLAVWIAAAPASVFAQAASPVQVQPRSRQIEGRILQVGSDHLVVRTRGNEQMTVHVRPQTRLLMRNKVIRLTDLRVGADVAVVAVPESDRLFADTVTLVAEEPVPAEEGTLVEGEIVRVIGEDQVLVRTAERKEVIVFVEPRTTYLLNDQPARFTDLRAGVTINAHVNVRDGRHTAHRVIVRPRR